MSFFAPNQTNTNSSPVLGGKEEQNSEEEQTKQNKTERGVTLRQMHAMVDHDPTRFAAEEKQAIETYWKSSQEQWNNGRFWVAGQLARGLDALLTPQTLTEAEEAVSKRSRDYGPPCNMAEACSVGRSKTTFTHFKTALLKAIRLTLMQKWKDAGRASGWATQARLEAAKRLYAPGGAGADAAAQDFADHT